MLELPGPIEFIWDKGNKDKNWLKHQVTNEECEEVFFDSHKKVSKDKLHSQKEERYILLSSTRNDRYLYVVFTLRENKIRVISARDLNRKEVDLYEEAT